MFPFILFLILFYLFQFPFHNFAPYFLSSACYRPFLVFHRDFTDGRSVPGEHGEKHRVGEDQGPNLLSRDLPRTPDAPPDLLRTSCSVMDTLACFLQNSLCVPDVPLVFNQTSRMSANRGEVLRAQTTSTRF